MDTNLGKGRSVKISKFLSRHLRHEPQRIGITLDARGRVNVQELLQAAAAHGFPFSRAELEEVVATSDKQRFAIEDGLIGANQGHSVAVDLELPVLEPPARLYHGTVGRFLPAIRAEGLRAMNRHAVHLSPDRETATRVGARRGRPVVLTVEAAAMHRDGHRFQLSRNGVWLVEAVPPRYLRAPDVQPPES
ncbi:RNA 2'-phosphotransferase [Streptomyces ovatisporus]|uniref:Probable RNA 2'-phosphotransferase n=1 Tax=Streptomyces ovatisporus TaxID=1128682 RepID=A0ABV9ABI9_9ACTN